VFFVGPASPRGLKGLGVRLQRQPCDSKVARLNSPLHSLSTASKAALAVGVVACRLPISMEQKRAEAGPRAVARG